MHSIGCEVSCAREGFFVNGFSKQGERHYTLLTAWMTRGASFDACMDLARARTPCTSGVNDRDLVATLMLGHQWLPQHMSANMRLLTVHAAAGRLGSQSEMATDLLPSLGLPLSELMARHPLTAAMMFAGGPATAVLIDHGLLDNCDVIGLLQTVVHSEHGHTERHRLKLVSTHDEAFIQLAEIALGEEPSTGALLTAAMMRRHIAAAGLRRCDDSMHPHTTAPARQRRTL